MFSKLFNFAAISSGFFPVVDDDDAGGAIVAAEGATAEVDPEDPFFLAFLLELELLTKPGVGSGAKGIAEPCCKKGFGLWYAVLGGIIACDGGIPGAME